MPLSYKRRNTVLIFLPGLFAAFAKAAKPCRFCRCILLDASPEKELKMFCPNIKELHFAFTCKKGKTESSHITFFIVYISK